MGFQNEMLDGFAQLLATASVAVYDESGQYDPNQTGICFQIMPSAPEGVVMLSTYPVSDDPSLSDSVLGLQVQTRMPGEDPFATNDLADAAFDQLHGLHDTTLPSGIRVVQCLHRGGSLLGMDALRRWIRSDNFYVTLWRPSLNRT